MRSDREERTKRGRSGPARRGARVRAGAIAARRAPLASRLSPLEWRAFRWRRRWRWRSSRAPSGRADEGLSLNEADAALRRCPSECTGVVAFVTAVALVAAEVGRRFTPVCPAAAARWLPPLARRHGSCPTPS
ncbi:Protein of unknown function, partial [Gryllus bimaculatus]